MSAKPSDASPKKITVVDRRHWARPDADDNDSAPKKPSYVEELEQKLNEREAKLNDTLAKHRQAVAEFEQARTRLAREVALEVERQRRNFLVELLEVVDNLERAVAAAQAGGTVEALTQGVTMVRDQFVTKLANLGVTRVPSLNATFDPKCHEALSMVPTHDAAQAGRVVGVIQEGYSIQGEVLRPAKVAVAELRQAPSAST